jgi:Tol biopolymer transport system component/DNA-binding winged helix-turn-helix (wHTH) protein
MRFSSRAETNSNRRCKSFERREKMLENLRASGNPEMKARTVYEFGPFRQDPSARTLTRTGKPVPITPKAFDTLQYLVLNAGRTVGRQELLQAVWPDTFVEEGNLNYNISQIRRALGEFKPGVPYIQTLPKQGYRFVADVNQVTENGFSTPVAPPAPAPEFRGLLTALIVTLGVGVVAAAVWWIAARFAPGSASMPALVRLTADSGLTMTPALSADGKLVAYASDRGSDGNLDIWVQPVDGGAAARLTDDPADDYAPSFSPDGRTVAFRSERDGGGVYVVPASGGVARRVVAGGRRPKFSPDGKWIAYWIGTEAGDTSSFFLPPGQAKAYIVSASRGAPKEICPEFAAAGYPIWTPDGRHLLFLGNREPNIYHEESMDWWVTPVEGGSVVRTGAHAAFEKMKLTVSQAPDSWAADATGVLTSAIAADARSIWRVPISASTWQVSGTPQRLTSGTTMDMTPSGAGNRLVFASITGTLDVWSLPAEANSNTPTGSIERLTQDADAHTYVAVSRDGTKIAFSLVSPGSRTVWVKDLVTGKQTRISKPPASSENPDFSPDGTKLIYRSAENRTKIAYVVPSSGGAAERICSDCTDYGWSSHQDKLLLVGESPARVSVLDVASKQKTALLDHSSLLLWNPRFSPDDRWIVFNATSPGTSRIFFSAARDAGMIPESEWIAATDSGWDDKPRWSPDGNSIYYLSKRDGFLCIWAQRLDEGKHRVGQPIAIFHAHGAKRSFATVGIGDLSLSIARDKIVFNLNDRRGNLWMQTLERR